MDGAQLEVVVVLPFLLLGVALVAALAWVPEASARGDHPAGKSGSFRDRLGARAGLLGSWLALTLLTIWCGAMVAFVVLHALLFTIGQAAASVGLFVTVVLLEATPFIWAIVILRRARRDGLGGGTGAEPKGPV